MPSKLVDKTIKTYAKQLTAVMGNLETEIIAFMNGIGKVSPSAAATLLNSRGEFIAFLQASGYNDLAAAYVNKYGEIPEAVNKAFASRKLPAPKFSTVSAETFSGLARIDLDGFSAIGVKAMDDLRIGLYKQVVAGDKFQNIVQTIKASTTGVSGKGSPLANYAYTHANTAILEFNGEVTREAGESIGFDSDSDEWEVIGPNDGATRDVCSAALSDPVRTRKEWQNADYWGGAPGGWNCRHELIPYFGGA